MAVSMDVTCLLGCENGTRPLVRSGVGSRYEQCQGCGLAFVSRPPARQSLERQYLEDASSPVSYYQRTAAVDRVTFARRLRLLMRFQPHRGRLLDVGCSTGTLMGVARKMGWNVEGVEPNPRAAEVARQEGFPVHEGILRTFLAGEMSGKYDCVVMSDVIEHLADPVEALSLVRELLAPGGFLLLTTPNLESFWCRRFQLKPEEHLFLFNDHNLVRLLAREAFQIRHLEETSRRRALGHLVHSTTELGRGLSTLVNALCRLRLDGALAWMMEYLFRDELLVIAMQTKGI